MDSVTFFTSCYENDWKTIVLNGGYENKLKNYNFIFDKKVLIINNVIDQDEVKSYVKKLL